MEIVFRFTGGPLDGQVVRGLLAEESDAERYFRNIKESGHGSVLEHANYSFLLYGMIAASGIRVMVDAQVDFSKSRNLTLTSVVFLVGLSGVAIKFGEVEFKGMVLACIVGMVLSLLFWIFDKLNLLNDNQ